MSLIGNYRHCYLAESASVQTKKQAAQAGVTTELLKTALRKGPVVVMTKDGLVSTTKQIDWNDSYYTFVGRYVQVMDKNISAVVCLPCKANMLKSKYPGSIVIGLFCSHVIDNEGLELLTEGIPAFRYKYQGKRGMLLGDQFIDIKNYWSRFFNYCYIPDRCIRCHDLTAEHADISIGDDHDKGYNIVITRTKAGQNLFNQTVKNIHIHRINRRKVYISQYHYINIKKGIIHPVAISYRIVRYITNNMSKHEAYFNGYTKWAKLNNFF